MFDNSTFVSNHSVTSNGYRSFSIPNNRNSTEYVNYDLLKQSKNLKKDLLYYKPISFIMKFEKTIKVKIKYISLHIGDIIDFFTKYTGIKKLIIKLTNGNCGCEARRKKFNKWFSIPVPIVWFTDHDYDDILNFKYKTTYESAIDTLTRDDDRAEFIKSEMMKQGNQYIENKTKNLGKKQVNSTNVEHKPSGCGCQSKMKKTVINK